MRWISIGFKYTWSYVGILFMRWISIGFNLDDLSFEIKDLDYVTLSIHRQKYPKKNILIFFWNNLTLTSGDFFLSLIKLPKSKVKPISPSKLMCRKILKRKRSYRKKNKILAEDSCICTHKNKRERWANKKIKR